MKRIFPKSKLARVNLALILGLLGVIVWINYGPEPWLKSEKVFMAGLHNSLWNLDRAKYDWATDNAKPEEAIPSIDDLASYLGEWKNSIEKFKDLGIEYKITSTAVPQSDVATLTKGIRFRAGICCFYTAGTSLSIRSGWKGSPASSLPLTLRVLLIRLHADFFFKAALLILLVVNALVFLVRIATISSSDRHPA